MNRYLGLLIVCLTACQTGETTVSSQTGGSPRSTGLPGELTCAAFERPDSSTAVLAQQPNAVQSCLANDQSLLALTFISDPSAAPLHQFIVARVSGDPASARSYAAGACAMALADGKTSVTYFGGGASRATVERAIDRCAN